MVVKSDGNGNLVVNKKLSVSLGILFILISLVVASVTYAKGIESRVDQVGITEELHYKELKEDVSEIKTDVKEIKSMIHDLDGG